MRLSRESRQEWVTSAEAARGPSVVGMVDALREHGYRGGWAASPDHDAVVLIAPGGGDLLADALWGEPDDTGAPVAGDAGQRSTPVAETHNPTLPPPATSEVISDEAYRTRW